MNSDTATRGRTMTKHPLFINPEEERVYLLCEVVYKLDMRILPWELYEFWKEAKRCSSNN